MPVHPECGHIQPDRGFPGLMRIKIHYSQDGVCGGLRPVSPARGAACTEDLSVIVPPAEDVLGEADQLRLIHVMEA